MEVEPDKKDRCQGLQELNNAPNKCNDSRGVAQPGLEETMALDPVRRYEG